MDTKNKLDEAYSGDKGGRRERIVVGLSGSLDSYVCAYLLKIQKYEVFAVTIAIDWDNFQGQKNNSLSCYLDEAKLENIREFCNQLKIPLHIVKAASEFQESVVEKWIATKATGAVSNACWSCHELRMKLIHQKMKELGVKFFATGHFAKIFQNEAQQSFYVHSSNDLENDQSSLLSRLPREVLSALKLPLSDLQKKEVGKLAENFGIKFFNKKVSMHKCFPEEAKINEYLNDSLPNDFVQEGDIVNIDDSENYGQHKGVTSYSYGQEMQAPTMSRSEKFFFSRYSFKDNKVFITHHDYYNRDRILLVNCTFSEDAPWLEPVKGAIKLAPDRFVDCWIYPKALKGALIEWEGEQSVKEGHLLAVYRKKGKNSKLLLTGFVKFLPKPETPEEGEEVPEEVDFSRDF
jgi:tRNA-specific 2-thiouridylase